MDALAIKSLPSHGYVPKATASSWAATEAQLPSNSIRARAYMLLKKGMKCRAWARNEASLHSHRAWACYAVAFQGLLITRPTRTFVAISGGWISGGHKHKGKELQ